MSSTREELTGKTGCQIATAMMDCLPEPAVVIGDDYRIVAANRAYRETFGDGEPILGHGGCPPVRVAGGGLPGGEIRVTQRRPDNCRRWYGYRSAQPAGSYRQYARKSRIENQHYRGSQR